jgi:hypothetical protein
MGWEVNATPLPLYRREKGPVHSIQETVRDLGPVGTHVENLTSSGFRPPEVHPERLVR